MDRILTCDILPIDRIIPVENQDAFSDLVRAFGLKLNGKTPVSHAQMRGLMERLPDITSPHRINTRPGGSSANTSVTLQKLRASVGNTTPIRFLGVTGYDQYGQIARASLEQSNIELLPRELSLDISPQTAISHAFLLPNGERTYAIYRGNPELFLTPDIITDALMQETDIVFVQGSLWQKLNPNKDCEPEFVNRLVCDRWEMHKQLWLTIPTDFDFAARERSRFQWLIPSADIVLGNRDELACIYPDDPFVALQRAFQKGILATNGKPSGRQQVAFITCDEEGSMVVTADDIRPVPAVPIDRIMNKGGAGDTATAGFLAGYLQGLDFCTSAEIGVALAGAKIRDEIGPRLASPMQALTAINPALAFQFIECDGTPALADHRYRTEAHRFS